MFQFLDKPLIVLSESMFITVKQIMLAILLIVLAWLISKFISKRLVNSLFRRTRMDKDSIILLQKVIFFALITAVILLVLSFLNIPLTTFAFISGGVAIGLVLVQKLL